MTRFWLAALACSACWRSQTPGPEVAARSPIEVTVSSVTLGDACEGDAEAERQSRKGAPIDFADAGCVQTSLQLALAASESGGTLRVKRVDLYAPDGDVVVIHAHTPTRWTGGVYRPWNQQIAANQRMKVSYALEAPDWNRLGGRWASHSRTFRVKVTLEIDAAEQTFETRSEVAAMREPMIET